MEKEMILKLKEEQEEKLAKLLAEKEANIEAKVAEYRASLEAEDSDEILEIRKIIAGLDEMLCPPVIEEAKPVIEEIISNEVPCEPEVSVTESDESEINVTYGQPDSDVKLTMEANKEIPCEEQVAQEIPCEAEVPVEEAQPEVEPEVEPEVSEPVQEEVSVKEVVEAVKAETIKPQQNGRNLFNSFKIR